MSVKWVVLLVVMFLVTMLVSTASSGLPTGAGAWEDSVTDDLNTISSWGVVSQEGDIGIWEIASAPYNFFKALFSVVAQPAEFMEHDDGFRWVKLAILAPMLVAFTFGVISLFIAGVQKVLS